MLTQQIKGSKRYKEAASKVDLTQSYSLQDASALLNTLPKAKFDETVELYAHLTVDPRKSDQMVRGTLQLPHGSGKTVRVIVFTENPQEALDNGADEAGLEDLIEKVTGGWTDFDVALSTTSAMKSVRTVARVLGPRGLMPSPKGGTVTFDLTQAIDEFKAGKLEFRADRTGIVHVMFGRASFSVEDLLTNLKALQECIDRNRPSGTKGRYWRTIFVSATMGPSIEIEVNSLRDLKLTEAA